jgi:Family of unknown function (DUF6519)
MKVDITRSTFDPQKQFTRVLMQQGRVQLDADWNEQAAILLHYLETFAADVIGPAGGPFGSFGFGIAAFDPKLKISNDFLIGAGRYYVDGKMVELAPDSTTFTVLDAAKKQIQVDAWSLNMVSFAKNQYVQLTGATKTPLITQITDIDVSTHILTVAADLAAAKASGGGTITRLTTYLTQPSFPTGPTITAGNYQVLLDVWEREITYVQDDSIREVALGGPDTAARAKRIWQIRLDQPRIGNAAGIPSRGSLKAIAKRSGSSSDPCTIAPDAKYTGVQNQLYRVEIHDGTADGVTPTFKFSRENGSVVFPILNGSGNSLTLETLGRDDRFGLTEGDWVEVTDDQIVALDTPNPLLQVASIDRTGRTVTLSGKPTFTKGLNPLLRRWDQTQGDPNADGTDLSNGVIAIIEDSATWINLESGIQVQFQKPATGTVAYRSGDYWLIPARTAIGDIQWPQEADTDTAGKTTYVPLTLPPDGIEHSIAPLAQISVDGGGIVTVSSDARTTFHPLK